MAVAAVDSAAVARPGGGDMNLSRWLKHSLIPDWAVRRVLSDAAMNRIESAIGQSEYRHRGQLRFAVEASLDPRYLRRSSGVRDRAIDVFSQLRVWDTEENNGVLIYLLLADRDVEIVADRGIDARVGRQGWESVCQAMELRLRAGNTEQAVLDGISLLSGFLETHFPVATGRINELPDTPVVLD